MICTLLLIIYNIDEVDRLRKEYARGDWSSALFCRTSITNLGFELWDFGIKNFGCHRLWNLIHGVNVHFINTSRTIQ